MTKIPGVFAVLLLVVFSAFPLYSQNQEEDRIDSLTRLVNRHHDADTARVNLMTELAFEFESSNPVKGIEYAEKAMSLALTLNYEAGIGKALLSKGVCFNAKGESSKALMILFQALRILQSAGDKDNIATTYLNIGNIYFNESDFDQTLYYYKQALKVLEDIGNTSRCASVYGNIGNVYYIKSEFPSSLEYQFKCIRLAEKSGNKRVEGNALIGVGNIYSKLPDYPKSLEYYYKALKIFELSGNKKGLSSAYGNIGIVYYRQSDFNKAIENFHKAGKFCEEICDNRGCATTFTNLGNVYVDEGKFKEALEYHLKANTLFEKINNRSGMASALGNIGLVYTQLGEYQKALSYYNRALVLNQDIGIKSGALYDLKGMGTLFLKMAVDSVPSASDKKIPLLKAGYKDNLRNAIHYSEMAVGIGKEVGELAPLVDAYTNISNAYQALNDWKKAFLYSDSANFLQDSLFSQEKQMKISEIETKRINEVKEKEIELFTLNIKHQRVAIAAISGGLLLMVLLALLIYRSLRIKKKTNKVLEEKNTLITYQKEKIELTQQKVQSDIDKAKDYVFSLLPQKFEDDYIKTDWIFIPSSQLGGDAFGYYWVDDDHFVFYILDTCGHGIGCALHSISVLNMIKSSVQLNVQINNPEELITALNESFLMEEHSDLFFSMWYGVYHKDSRELKYVCAGHPFPLIIDDTQVVFSSGKPNIPIGWFSKFKYVSETVKMYPGTRIYLFSDGLYELQKPDGAMMSLNEFLSILVEENKNDPFDMECLIQKLQQIQGTKDFDDDLSLIRLEFK